MTTTRLPGAEARIGHGVADLPATTDLVVIGLGVTGAGVALDAAARGLRVVAVEAHDIAWGTSRFSSKLVHGGLRYLAQGQVGVAHESAVERGILMEHTAPHLVHALPMLLPLTPATSRTQALLARAGTRAGDLLRIGARTSRETLPRPRRIGVTETRALAPAVRAAGLRGGILSWDGQLEDDARFVLGLARTAVAQGAVVRTRVRVVEAGGRHVVVRDELTGETRRVDAAAVVNATGVWAETIDPSVRLKPSRGSHLVLHRQAIPQLRCALMVPVPGHANRFVFALPQPDDRCYVGLTDEEVDGPLPEVPTAPEADITFLLDVVNAALETALTRDDVVGHYAGLRPLLRAEGATSDISRRHAVLVASDGLVTIVGGKLTTYRRMAQDAVDRALEVAGLPPHECRTHDLPLLGAVGSASDHAPARLVRRFGSEADLVLTSAREVTGLDDRELLTPGPVGITLAELVFGITHEGAVDADDLLDRRTRVGLVPADREAALPLAERALALVSARS